MAGAWSRTRARQRLKAELCTASGAAILMSASGQKLPFDIYQDPSISAVQSCLINHYHPGVMALDEERALQFRCPVQTPTAPLITDGALTEGRQHQVISELEMYPLTPSGHPMCAEAKPASPACAIKPLGNSSAC
ncbi:hypothetical protein B9Y64_12715 [Stenotrophomonas maltophilia]|uniref:Uncharacterized protein n=1 Tax=Stenotrophomonas maltophilia TaxID=40324 RepID=A0A2J0UAK8_STEMA|nr:hypothetical protein [Stenotrophomonas maltophilia]PJL28092.1 hypothetical protein B9Y64_12715 [Stenotrophomonas maltophilia]